MTSDQLKALRIFEQATNGYCDPWDLMGPRNTGKRVEIMSHLAGRPVPRGNAGVHALREALWDLFPERKPASLVGQQDQLKAHILKVLV